MNNLIIFLCCLCLLSLPCAAKGYNPISSVNNDANCLDGWVLTYELELKDLSFPANHLQKIGMCIRANSESEAKAVGSKQAYLIEHPIPLTDEQRAAIFKAHDIQKQMDAEHTSSLVRSASFLNPDDKAAK